MRASVFTKLLNALTENSIFVLRYEWEGGCANQHTGRDLAATPSTKPTPFADVDFKRRANSAAQTMADPWASGNKLMAP